MARAIFTIAALASAEDGLSDVLNNNSSPGIIILGVAAIPSLFFLVRWMIKFQRDFTNFYVEENQKLRDRVDELEKEVKQKDDFIFDMRTEMQVMKLKILKHESTIEHLEGIIERRKLDKEQK